MLRCIAERSHSFARRYLAVAYVRLALVGICLGLLTGGVAVGFFAGIEYGKHVLLVRWAGLQLPVPGGEKLFHAVVSGGAPRLWVVPLVTTLVALLTGWLVQRFLPASLHGITDGTDTMIRAFHRDEGVIRARTPLIKGLTSILTIASGGSAGREGPISLLGAGMGSWVGRRLGLSARERRLVMLAGAAGGLGAIFRAPLGGALTAIEVAYREDFEAEALLPAVLSSVVAYTVFSMVYGTQPLFAIPRFTFTDARELGFYLVLALACAGAGWLYVHTFRLLKYGFFLRIAERTGLMWSTTLGGLMVGLLGVLYTPVLSDGYGWLEQAILGQLGIVTMLTILVGKTLATAVTLGSGMSGGMFAPALFVGGMTGGVVGKLAHILAPDTAREPGSYVLVGMAAFFAGVAHAPLGPLVMVCELTQGYGLLAPLMLCSAVCTLLGRKASLYENQEDSKFTSPAHSGEAVVGLLSTRRVAACYRPGLVPTLESGSTLRAMTDIIAGTTLSTFPVRGADGMLTGLVSVMDLRPMLYEDGLFDLVVADEVKRPLTVLALDDDLYTALLAFAETDLGQIPVQDEADNLCGMLHRADLFVAAHAAAPDRARQSAVHRVT